MVSGKCPESRTFRTGGDEFVTVLLGKDYADRERVLREIRADQAMYAEKEAYHRRKGRYR